MASRPSIRALTKLASTTLPRRHLHITGPATYPSPILTETRTSSSNPPSSKRPQAGASSSSSSSTKDDGSTPATRQFNTSRSLKSVGDSSTIDFFYLPDLSTEAEDEAPIRVPLISGNAARAMHADEPEATLRPMINLISGGHIQEPSAMSEVADNGSVHFEGLHAPVEGQGQQQQEVSVVKQVWDGFLDDVFGPKKK